MNTLARKLKGLENSCTANMRKAENGEEAISFEFNYATITNPFFDETGRFEQSAEEAIEYYGVENIQAFVQALLAE